VCSQCQVVWYCGVACQKKNHWRNHKVICTQLASLNSSPAPAETRDSVLLDQHPSWSSCPFHSHSKGPSKIIILNMDVPFLGQCHAKCMSCLTRLGKNYHCRLLTVSRLCSCGTIASLGTAPEETRTSAVLTHSTRC
jgi:MYND finger